MKILNTKSSWSKFIGQKIHIWEDNSAWDGAGEWFEPYVVKVTEKGVWFSNDFNDEVFRYWVNFKKIQGYTKRD